MLKSKPQTLRSKSVSKMRTQIEEFDSKCELFHHMHSACECIDWIQRNPEERMGSFHDSLSSSITFLCNYYGEKSNETDAINAAKENLSQLRSLFKAKKTYVKRWITDQIASYEQSADKWFSDNFVPGPENITA